jgi:4-hydroxy-2-oxoheptanedioate aldolase
MHASPLAAFADRLKAGNALFTGWCSLTDPLVAGAFARAGYDAVTLDWQHGYHDVRSMLLGIGEVTLAGRPALVRIPVADFALASRALDLGAAGIIAPMINSAEDARTLVEHTKFPPLGERSWGPARALMLTGMDLPTYLKEANRFSLTIAMTETRRALDAIDTILAVDGIDGILFGPSDTSIALSNGQRIDPYHSDVEAAMDHVVARCRTAGKIACGFAPSAERARAMAKKGYQLISIANDMILLRQGIEAQLKIARG